MTLTHRLSEGNDTLVVLIGGEEEKDIDIPESVLFVQAEDWNRDLSPWPAERVFRRGEDFAGKADDTTAALEELVRPYRERYQTMILAGYSLAGLFALYACTKTDLFDACMSASGSLWYPGWMEYLKEHPVKCRKVYLSLGDTEKNTRSPVMAKVEDNTKKSAEIIGGYAEVITEMNPGNHFNDPSGRIVKGIRRLCA